MSISDTRVPVATTWTPSTHVCRAQKESRAFSGVLLGFSGWSAPVSASSGHVYHSIKVLAQRNFHRLLCRQRVGTWCGKSNWKVGEDVNAGPVVVSTLTPGLVKGENNLTNGKAKRTSFPVSMSILRSAGRRSLGGLIDHDRLPCCHVQSGDNSQMCAQS